MYFQRERSTILKMHQVLDKLISGLIAERIYFCHDRHFIDLYIPVYIFFIYMLFTKIIYNPHRK